uniref:Bestrophin homolog n=1 Tax=Ditylenchus dipsaci TaxID=166011 RepID=A0A915EIE7_9BILA
MTISYEEEFSSLMLRWRGSLWKAVLKDLIAFYIAYYIILFAQWYLLDEKQKEYFTGWIHWCEIGSQYIPLSFLLGFFVAVVVARWWEQFNWISWPDKMMMTVSTCFSGKENLEVRKTIARWSSLQSAIAWTGISVRTLKRFPTERHLVESKLMTEEEYDMYTNTNAPHGKWFVPIMWILNLVKLKHREKKIDTIQLDMLMKQIFSFRDGFAMLYVYDWVKIPLVYTQVVAIATYGYFFICLLGRQPKLDEKSMQTEITILFPIFTTFQMLFYVGWLKVGQFLMNPFGEDDDDFELNYVLDRNTCIAHMMATELADQLPSKISHDLTVQLPHTRASFKIQDIIPKSHLSDFSLTLKDMQLIRPEELEQTRKEKGSKIQKNRMNLFQRLNNENKDSKSLTSNNAEQIHLTTAENATDPITEV